MVTLLVSLGKIRKNTEDKILSIEYCANVIEYARNINLLGIIVSSDFKQETEKIKKLYPGSTIEIINLEDFGERNMMRDVD